MHISLNKPHAAASSLLTHQFAPDPSLNIKADPCFQIACCMLTGYIVLPCCSLRKPCALSRALPGQIASVLATHVQRPAKPLSR